MLTVANVEKVQNFNIISDKFNVVTVCSSGNYAQKWATKLYSY
jgi:rhodanese-related sulfurtransferase